MSRSEEEVLFCKGSGWDLAVIEVEGFAPLRLNALLKLAELDSLSDTDMVTQQRVAMLDPSAPKKVVIPSALQMGWKNSPAFFCTVTLAVCLLMFNLLSFTVVNWMAKTGHGRLDI